MNNGIEKYKFYYNIFIICLAVQCFWGFTQEEILPFTEGIRSYIFLLTDIAFLFLGLATLRKRSDKIMIISFGVLMFASNYINSIGLATTINGFRDFFSLLFILPFIRYYLEDDERREYFISRIDKFIIIFLIAQIPTSVFQVLKYGVGDHVGGTMGNGYSGVMSTLIYLLLFYLLQKMIGSRDKATVLLNNWFYFLLLIPTMINETKSSFVYLLIMTIAFFKIDRKLLLRIIVAIPIAIFVLVPAVTSLYLSVTGAGDEVFTVEYYTEMYLLDDDAVEWALSDDEDAEGQDLPRFAKLVEGWLILDEDNDMLLGKGVGLFKGKTMGIVEQIPFALEYKWLLYGSIIMLFVMLIQLGVLGVVWFIAYFIVNSPNILKSSRMNMNLYFMVFAVFLFLLLYNNSFNLPCFATFFIYLLLVSKFPVLTDNTELEL